MSSDNQPMITRGPCTSCLRPMPVRLDGCVRSHGPVNTRCPGSGRPLLHPDSLESSTDGAQSPSTSPLQGSPFQVTHHLSYNLPLLIRLLSASIAPLSRFSSAYLVLHGMRQPGSSHWFLKSQLLRTATNLGNTSLPL